MQQAADDNNQNYAKQTPSNKPSNLKSALKQSRFKLIDTVVTAADGSAVSAQPIVV